MEIDVTQENLNKALSVVARVAGGRSSLPVLSNVLLKIVNSRLSISATNLDIAITQNIGAKVQKEGSITVPARLMQDFINNLPKGKIHLKQEDHKLHIEAEHYSSTINGVSAEEFPVMPEIKDGVGWEIDAGEFKTALQKVVFAASADDARPVLTGVNFMTDEGKLFIAATDSFRLAEASIANVDKEVKLLIPANAMQEILRVVGDVEKIQFKHDDQQVLITCGEVELVARLIDGNYPDYKKLIPPKFTNTAKLAKEDLASITKVSSLFARETAGSITVQLNADESKISVHSVASQVGENTSEAVAVVKGEGEITLNSRYLLDGLGAIEGEDVDFSFNGKLEPIKISGKSDNYLHIIMPLKS
ncbi:MAG: DNA polymerase III subunit beta [bacterium]|nr:DNA polymerase III subunit beta [bacterium]